MIWVDLDETLVHLRDHQGKCVSLGIDARRLVFVPDREGQSLNRFSRDRPAVVERVREILRGNCTMDDLNVVREDR